MNLENLHIYSSSDWWWIPAIVGFFALIVLVIILLKKKVKIFQDDAAPKSDKEIAAEEVSRLLVDVEEPLVEKTEEPADKE